MKNKFLILALVVPILFVWASVASAESGTEGVVQISLADAVDMGLDNSKEYIKAAKGVDVALIDREDARDAFNSTKNANYNVGTGAWTYDTNYETAQNAYYGGQASYDVTVLQYDLTKDLVVSSVYNSYYDLLELEEKLAVAKANLDRDELQYMIKKVYVTLGMSTEMDLIQAESKLIESQSKYYEAQRNIADSRKSFKELLGLDEADDFILVDKLKYIPAKLLPEDLDKLYTGILNNDPTIRMAGINKDLYYNMIGYYKTDKAELEADMKDLTADILRETKRKVLRELCSTMSGLEETYAATEKKLKLVEESYRIKSILYKVGMATKADLVSAEADMLAIKQGLFTVAMNYELTKMKFYKPWIITSNQ